MGSLWILSLQTSAGLILAIPGRSWCRLRSKDGGELGAEPLLVLINGHFTDFITAELDGCTDIRRADLPVT